MALLAVRLDACSRKIVGWATSNNLHSTLVTDALERAWRNRRPGPGFSTILIEVFSMPVSVSERGGSGTAPPWSAIQASSGSFLNCW